MTLSYGTQISPHPINLPIGTLRKPLLKDIAEMTFEKFGFFGLLTRMTPHTYYEKIVLKGNPIWKEMTQEEKDDSTIYDMICVDKNLCKLYLDMFNYFFYEDVTFQEGIFLLFRKDVDSDKKADADSIVGVISKDTFLPILDLIQQVCCIHDTKNEVPKFKNSRAKKIYEKLRKAEQEQQATKNDINLSIPNIISSVATKHFSLNYTNIWDLTLFQLIDTFSRLQINDVHGINSLRVSVWGDEKNVFDASLWYKNTFDKK